LEWIAVNNLTKEQRSEILYKLLKTLSTTKNILNEEEMENSESNSMGFAIEDHIEAGKALVLASRFLAGSLCRHTSVNSSAPAFSWPRKFSARNIDPLMVALH
jgi:hypothetical protein